jgi:DNA-binding transcriptional MerR regulator
MTYYTLADIERSDGALKHKRYAIQLWAREGLLKPLSTTRGKGRGVARRYEKNEVELARMIALLSDFCTLEALRCFAKCYRLGVKRKEDLSRLVFSLRLSALSLGM